MSRWFTDRMKMPDLITTNYNIILLLPRLGVRLGFGDRSVAEVCQQNGILCETLLMVCNCYTFPDYEPDIDAYSTRALQDIVPFLMRSHNYYINERLPHIERHLNHVASQAGEQYASILKQFFSSYRDDIVKHFTHEEKKIFPMVQTRLAGGAVSHTVTSSFSKAHNSINEKLSDLTQILFKYLPGEGIVEELNELVFAILQLSDDLDRHTKIEDKILFPIINRKEVE